MTDVCWQVLFHIIQFTWIPEATGMSAATWSNGINGLSAGLARLLGERSAAGWKSVITEARRKRRPLFSYKTESRL